MLYLYKICQTCEFYSKRCARKRISEAQIHVAEKDAREKIAIAIGSCIFQRSRYLLDRMFVRSFDVGANFSPGSAKGNTR